CRSRSYRQADMFDGSLPPDQVALGKPLVQFYWLLYTTSGVSVPYTSGALASRLPDYFKPEHCETEVDAASLARINFGSTRTRFITGLTLALARNPPVAATVGRRLTVRGAPIGSKRS
ncbi:MAG: hypothetical protein IJN32_02495, partial [Thermoguttaceae bacterium]|nr:hypothetical protein [Thermoguttaceae bacterium]